MIHDNFSHSESSNLRREEVTAAYRLGADYPHDFERKTKLKILIINFLLELTHTGIKYIVFFGG